MRRGLRLAPRLYYYEKTNQTPSLSVLPYDHPHRTFLRPRSRRWPHAVTCSARSPGGALPAARTGPPLCSRPCAPHTHPGFVVAAGSFPGSQGHHCCWNGLEITSTGKMSLTTPQQLRKQLCLLSTSSCGTEIGHRPWSWGPRFNHSD